jgi:hypothetical protein
LKNSLEVVTDRKYPNGQSAFHGLATPDGDSDVRLDLSQQLSKQQGL